LQLKLTKTKIKSLYKLSVDFCRWCCETLLWSNCYGK